MPVVLIPSRTLTPRQAEVVQLLADGLRVRDIGEKLGISESGVFGHIDYAKGKKGVDTIGGLVAAAMREGEVK